VASPADVAAAPLLAGFSAEMHAENRELKSFLRDNLYRHYRVQRMTTKARRIVRDLFGAFHSDVRLLPTEYRARADREGAPRAIADYIAGMTDRYAVKEHRRLFAVGMD
jgi:dGTPase